MRSNIRVYEDPFMDHITSGEFSIDTEGRIWKHRSLDMAVIDPPRRADRGYPGKYRQVRFYLNGNRRASQGGPTADYVARRNYETVRDEKGRIIGKAAAKNP